MRAVNQEVSATLRELSCAEKVRDDVYALLEVDVTYPGWESGTAEKKAFYVRGFSWFRDKVLGRHIYPTACGSYVPGMKKLLRERPGWLERPFRWQEDFALRQFVNSASSQRRLTQKFYKAAETILLCDVIAADLHRKNPQNPPADAVYEHMRIEPAVSFVHDLNKNVLQSLSPEQFEMLRRWTGQPNREVFFEMAAGDTVTHKLAQRTKRYFNKYVPEAMLGEPDFRFWPKRTYKPSGNENFDVKEEDLPYEARTTESS